MNIDLARVITLQQLDSGTHEAERRLAEQPEREKAFEQRLEAASTRLASARERLADNQNARRATEKDVAMQQGRLSKFRDQLMEVKTNREYQAMQHEIEVAQNEVKALEEKVLERMLEADELSAAVKQAEAELTAEQKGVAADRQTMSSEHEALEKDLQRIAGERAALVAAIDRHVLDIFELVARRRNGVAVAEARDGVCAICHVRLRPQVFNTIRGNDEIIQCDSCQRIMYFAPATAGGVGQAAS